MGNILDLESKHLGDVIVKSSRVEVFALNDLKFGSHVATKISLGLDKTNNELKEEYKMLKTHRHENIVTVFELCRMKKENRFGYFMEYLSGGSLKEVLYSNTFTSNEANTWITQIANAMEYLHSKGIVHGNLTPAKIFLNSTQTVAKLSGFLPCESVDKHESKKMDAFAYSAPEVILVSRMNGYGCIDQKSDVYSMAVILWHLTARREPFDSSMDFDQFLHSIVSSSFRLQQLDRWNKETNEFVQRSLDKDSSHRPTMLQFYNTVRNIR